MKARSLNHSKQHGPPNGATTTQWLSPDTPPQQYNTTCSKADEPSINWNQPSRIPPPRLYTHPSLTSRTPESLPSLPLTPQSRYYFNVLVLGSILSSHNCYSQLGSWLMNLPPLLPFRGCNVPPLPAATIVCRSAAGYSWAQTPAAGTEVDRSCGRWAHDVLPCIIVGPMRKTSLGYCCEACMQSPWY